MKIGNLNTSEKVLIIAEIGNNHEGSFENAIELVKKAAETGVDAVKFQTFRTDNFVSRSNTARYNQLKSYELSYEQFEKLSELARSLGLLFISTPFDLDSAEFLYRIVDAYKIASGDNNFYALIEKVARKERPLIISLGGTTAEEVSKIFQFVSEFRSTEELRENLAMLHCVCSYPVPPEEANLLAIKYLAENLDCTSGYSDHTIGIDAALLSVALGARVIEKHFTLDNNFSDFRDHKLSANPQDMKTLVEKVRLASSMLGSFEKRIMDCEIPILVNVRRSLVARENLRAGHKISISDIQWLRPSGGLSPGQEHLLLGKTTKRDIACGDQITLNDVN
jgi:N,N'-diacetyllegionaminate synthase